MRPNCAPAHSALHGPVKARAGGPERVAGGRARMRPGLLQDAGFAADPLSLLHRCRLAAGKSVSFTPLALGEAAVGREDGTGGRRMSAALGTGLQVTRHILCTAIPTSCAQICFFSVIACHKYGGRILRRGTFVGVAALYVAKCHRVQ